MRERGGCSLERLECRQFLAGDVSAAMVRGGILLTGDASDNHVVLDRAGLNNDQVRVTGVAGTTVNGLASVVLDGFTGDLSANTGAGADAIDLTALDLPGDVGIGGRGSLAVALDGTIVRGGLGVQSAGSADVSLSGGTNIAGAFSVRSSPRVGGGLLRVRGIGSTIGGTGSFSSGEADFDIAFDNCSIGPLTLRSGGQAGALGVVNGSTAGGLVRLTAREATVKVDVLQSTVAGAVTVRAGVIDTFTLGDGASSVQGDVLLRAAGTCLAGFGAGSTVGGEVRLTAAGGFGSADFAGRVRGDVVLGFRRAQGSGGTLAGVFDGDLTINGGRGADLYQGEGMSVAGRFRFSGAQGDDVLLLDDSTVTGLSQLILGDGADQVSLETTTTGGGGVSQFLGPLQLRAGAGDDVITAGAGGDANRQVSFLSDVMFDGGPGNADALSLLNILAVSGPVLRGFEIT